MAGKGGRLVFGNTHKGWRFSLMSSPTAKGALFFLCRPELRPVYGF